MNTPDGGHAEKPTVVGSRRGMVWRCRWAWFTRVMLVVTPVLMVAAWVTHEFAVGFGAALCAVATFVLYVDNGADCEDEAQAPAASSEHGERRPAA